MNINVYLKRQYAGLVVDQAFADAAWNEVVAEVAAGSINKQKICEAMRRCDIVDKKMIKLQLQMWSKF